MKEIRVKVYKKELEKRLAILNKHTGDKIVPVIKNNANGIGFENAARIFAPYVKMMATSYANEWFKYDDKKMQEEIGVDAINFDKLAWIWSVKDENLKNIYRLVLACDSREKMQFCKDNNIGFFVEINAGMNRFGFDVEEAIKVIKDMRLPFVNVMMHCPYEDLDGLENYKNRVNEILGILKDAGIKVGQTTFANSYVTARSELYGDFCRIGELLLLPHIDKFGVSNTMNVSTYISKIRELKKGDWVGYRKHQLKDDTRVAILPVGYYSIEDIEYVKINGNLCKVLCQMHDTMVVDIRNYDICEGDEVILMDMDLYDLNKKSCIQRSYKLNPDMIYYEIIDGDVKSFVKQQIEVIQK